jgi:2-succinyl-5-enolpyruvyl-6-hydroxy-3-cyclohexene-1-carboxylate synthase
VHLNLPFDEPLFGAPLDLPEARDDAWESRIVGRGWSDKDIASFVNICSGRSGVIVAGKGSSASLLSFAQQIGWPVFADPRSGLRTAHSNVVVAFDPILRAEKFVADVHPKVIVFVGEPPASKVLSQWARQGDAIVVHCGEVDVVVDPLHIVANSFVGDLEELFDSACADVRSIESSWLSTWKKADEAATSVITDWVAHNWSEIAVAHTVSRALAHDSHCVVSSSMPIRDFEWFGAAINGAVVHANRGANGIDGVVSTAVGVALGSDETTYLLIGDIACIHDSNGLWGLSRRGLDVRIVVTNNDGGAIFSFLPQAQHVDAAVFEKIYGTPHGVSFASLAQAHGIEYCQVSSVGELEDACGRVGPIIIEAKFDRSIDVGQHEAINVAVVNAVEKSMA